MKNPLTLAGIEPATFRFVAQQLNHCATAVPPFFFSYSTLEDRLSHIKRYSFDSRFVFRRTAVFRTMKRKQAAGDREDVAEEVM